jgi:hypothetical protein
MASKLAGEAANRKLTVPPATQRDYPGQSATAEQVLQLAEEYRKAAQSLVQQGRRRAPLSWAPCRLAAIHAIELYLSALLLHAGLDASAIRAMQHSLAKRTDSAIVGGLKLRKRTTAHLAAMEGSREYLVTRYGPEMTATLSQINRLMASLVEVAAKVTGIVAKKPH